MLAVYPTVTGEVRDARAENMFLLLYFVYFRCGNLSLSSAYRYTVSVGLIMYLRFLVDLVRGYRGAVAQRLTGYPMVVSLIPRWGMAIFKLFLYSLSGLEN